MSRLQDLAPLSNRYFFLRHGQSQAQVQGIIVSQPENGINGYGLTEEGRRQVESSVKESQLNEQVVIYSSPFARAKESAEIAQLILKAKPIKTDPRLGERSFGDLEMKADIHYKQVWGYDRGEAILSHNGVEELTDVIERTTSLISDLEHRYSNQTILLVSHADVILAMMAAFAGRTPAQQGMQGYPDTGEIGKLKLLGS